MRSNSIGIGHYPIDSKPVHSKTDMSTPDKGEGDFFLSNVITPFQVPFGAIIPKNVEGLVVPVALSATHVAFSAIRMDATWMVIGQAAGVAAAISVKESVAVREIPVTKIQDELLKQKCKLAFYWDVPIEHPYFADIQKATVSGWIDPDMSFDFYPDSLLTRAQAAQLLVKAFDVWPSVSNVHFTDVDYRHEAFVSVETLFDIGVLDALGIVPRWPQAGGYAEASDGFDQIKSNFGEFFPDKPMSGNEFHTLARRILLSTRKTGAIHREIDPPAMRLTKGEAVAYLMKLIN